MVLVDFFGVTIFAVSRESFGKVFMQQNGIIQILRHEVVSIFVQEINIQVFECQ